MPAPLLSRGLDPLLGVFTGCLAYYLYETNPRNQLASEDKLGPLINWRWQKWTRLRAEKHAEAERLEWEAVNASNLR